jgi:FMN phosphatase YigB (HAD superfamily)
MNSTIEQSRKNFIVDFGGVLYEIDHLRTFSAFAEYSRTPKLFKKSEIQSIAESEIFVRYERGLIPTLDFRRELRRVFNLECYDSEFDSAWNATLVGQYESAIQDVSFLK